MPSILEQILWSYDPQRLQSLAKQYRTAKPFQHLIIDDFLPAQFCTQLVAEFPPYDMSHFHERFGQHRTNIKELGASFSAIDSVAKSSEFLAWLKAITGIRGLFCDPNHFASGAREYLEGMSMWPHVDPNPYIHLGWRRRINLIVYLTHNWISKMGGSIVFQKRPGSQKGLVRVPPIFNRCVIFPAGHRAWHSVEPVHQTKSDCGRRSVSFSFYTRTSRVVDPSTQTWAYQSGVILDLEMLEEIKRILLLKEQATHSSGKRDRRRFSLPAAWEPGHVLTKRDARWLRCELADWQKELFESWQKRISRLDEKTAQAHFQALYLYQEEQGKAARMLAWSRGKMDYTKTGD